MRIVYLLRLNGFESLVIADTIIVMQRRDSRLRLVFSWRRCMLHLNLHKVIIRVDMHFFVLSRSTSILNVSEVCVFLPLFLQSDRWLSSPLTPVSRLNS